MRAHVRYFFTRLVFGSSIQLLIGIELAMNLLKHKSELLTIHTYYYVLVFDYFVYKKLTTQTPLLKVTIQ